MLVLGLYLLFLSSLTYFVVHHNSLRHYDSGDVCNNTLELLEGNYKRNFNLSPFSKTAVWILTIFSILSMIKEVLQMISQRSRYFTDQQNAFEWVLYVTTLLFSAPFIMSFSFHWQWEAGALSVFFAWFNLLVILQRFDFFGIYVVMFLEILRTLLQALCVFSVLIVAFGLSYMLLSHEETHAYKSPGLSLMRTAMMMLELDYMASFNEPFTDDDDTTLHFGGLTLFMVALFVLLMPILLMSLLIGLAVGDIEFVQRNARLKRLAGQVELHSDMERKMPLFLLARFDQPIFKYYPNKCKNKLANFWSRMTMTDREELAASNEEMNRQALMEELLKQKHKVKEMGSMLDKNNQLLKLIVQKMEIQTEDDAWDEGHNHDSADSTCSVAVANGAQTGNKINSNSFRRKMLQKSSVVSYMRAAKDKK